MNEFEKDVQSKTNDVVDSIAGFGVSFLFFAILFVIATTIHLLGN